MCLIVSAGYFDAAVADDYSVIPSSECIFFYFFFFFNV